VSFSQLELGSVNSTDRSSPERFAASGDATEARRVTEFPKLFKAGSARLTSSDVADRWDLA
jgi:hypothetical protein